MPGGDHQLVALVEPILLDEGVAAGVAAGVASCALAFLPSVSTSPVPMPLPTTPRRLQRRASTSCIVSPRPSVESTTSRSPS
ncbi:MAG TPA: hypothetical protein VGR22_09720 [Thermomicrobiales bacterium]|nr:hypothetical protein [Thermomicrobiales bacterium]